MSGQPAKDYFEALYQPLFQFICYNELAYSIIQPNEFANIMDDLPCVYTTLKVKHLDHDRREYQKWLKDPNDLWQRGWKKEISVYKSYILKICSYLWSHVE